MKRQLRTRVEIVQSGASHAVCDVMLTYLQPYLVCYHWHGAITLVM